MSFIIFILLILLLTFIMASVFLVTDKLLNISKSNKFRKWWSNNIVDLDDKYTE
jgi:hypothetical protein